MINEGLTADETTPDARPPDVSVISLISTLLQRRRMIIACGLIGASLGAATGLLSEHRYEATATFLPQGTDSPSSGLAAAASQFGIRIPASGSGWGVPIYVELLRSRELLMPIARETLTVAEHHGRRESTMDLLKIEAPTPALRTELTVRALREIVVPAEDKLRNAVTMTVTSPWPSVSYEIANRMLQEVDRFNASTRKSQAGAERQFAEQQAAGELLALRGAEDRLQAFLQSNRVISGSPQLEFERDRLQRDVNLHQQIYNSLVQNAEEARIREVRDTPVITILEPPTLPLVPRPRRTAFKTIAGGLVGGILGILAAFLLSAIDRWRNDTSPAAQEFFLRLADATPAFLRRRWALRGSNARPLG